VSRVGFTLLELIIVVFLIALISFLVIKLPSFNKSYSYEDIRKLLYPSGVIYVFEDNKAVIIKKKKKKTINFKTQNAEVYNIDFERIKFKPFEDNKVVFKYVLKNGIGEVYIVKTSKKTYLFKPLWIKKFSSLNAIKNYLLSLQPALGEYH
jgi:hypothetical protein